LKPGRALGENHFLEKKVPCFRIESCSVQVLYTLGSN
jgi:hypothetical protein